MKKKTLTIGGRGISNAIWPAFISLLLLASGLLLAHSDLDLQIEKLSVDISRHPADTELLLKRGDLYRRHGDWEAGRTDFEKVRELQPDHPRVDWFEGRLLVASGEYSEGEAMLSRFLLNSPDHSGAHQARAVAREHLHEPLKAAKDYRAAISTSKHPSPSLYRSLVLSYVSAGIGHIDAAISATDQGLGRFPFEVSLLGLGTDLSLSRSDVQMAAKYMAGVQPGLRILPQWRFRLALQSCIEGENDVAAEQFAGLVSAMPADGAARTGTWQLEKDTVSKLAFKPDPEACSKAAWDMLKAQNK